MRTRLVIILIFLVSYNHQSVAQTFYFDERRHIKQDIKRKQRRLRKQQKIDLPFPINTLWLKDSVFIADFELTLNIWARNYGITNDTSLITHINIDKLLDYHIDSVYALKSKKAYQELRSYSGFLSSILFVDKIERPITFLDSADIFNYISHSNELMNHLIKTRDNKVLWKWYWNRFHNQNLKIICSLLTIKDFMKALNRVSAPKS